MDIGLESRNLRYHSSGNYSSSYSSHVYNESSYTITTSVTIRVTPKEDHFVSWGILWGFFVLGSVVALYQVIRENRIMANRRVQSDDGEQVNIDGESVSTADITRSMFRRLLLLAMVARVTLIPVQIWSWPIWCQFVGDTLPEMIYASAWTLLVTFFVQLVGIATGTGTNTSPGIVISATAYVVYTFLAITELFNNVASVLLYALLCCIYSALFGTALYFCPRLISLLQPSISRHHGLATRLIVCNVLCVLVFGAHTFTYARIVVSPPRRVYWWWTYGAMELIPSFVFLIIMHPSATKANRDLDHGIDNTNSSTSGRFPSNYPPNHPYYSHQQQNNKTSSSIKRVDSSGLRRVDSVGSQQQQPPPPPPPTAPITTSRDVNIHPTGSSASLSKTRESSSLMKAVPNYGGTTGTEPAG